MILKMSFYCHVIKSNAFYAKTVSSGIPFWLIRVDLIIISVCFEVELGLHYKTVHHIQINPGTDEFSCTAGCPEESFLIFNIFSSLLKCTEVMSHKLYDMSF